MPKRTYQPSKIKRKRKFGFRALLKKGTKPGAILKRKRKKGRKKLAVA